MKKLKKKLHFKSYTLLRITVLLMILASGINNLKSEPIKLTLDDAIEKALLNSADTKIALMDINKAEAKVNEAFGYALPTVDLSANFMHYIEKPKIPFIDFVGLLQHSMLTGMAQTGVLVNDPNTGQPVPFTYDKPYVPKYSLLSFTLANSYEARVQASQILFNSAVFKGIGASKIYLDLSQEAYKSTAAKVIVNVKRAFYGVLLTEQMLNILYESLKNAESNLKFVDANYRQGFVSEFDLLTVKVQVENLRPVVMQLENGLQNAKNGLKIILGLNQNDDVVTEGEIVYSPAKTSDEEQLISKALNKNYDLRTYEIKRAVDEKFIELDKAEYWPTIAAFGSYSMSGQSDKFDFMKYNTGLVGLNFSINLFNGLRTNEKVQQSSITVLQTDEQLKQMKEFIKTQVKSKIMELNRVQKLIEAQEKNIELAQKAYNISTLKYKEGTGTQLEIQNAGLALRQAKNNKLQSSYDYIIALSELEQLTGEIDSKYFNINK